MRNLILTTCILVAGSLPCAADYNILLLGAETEGMSAANHGIDTNATGGLLGDGITFNPVTNMLTFNMGYGAAADPSFVDLGSDYTTSHFHIIAGPVEDPRSEERRVGKECRSRWSRDHLKKKGEAK